MTDRRPPKEASPTPESEADADARDQGKRSQTLPLGSSHLGRGATPPRSTFSSQSADDPPPPQSGKRANPSAWGSTLLIGNAGAPPAGAEPAHAQPPAAAEPLRMPSARPTPSPYQESRGQQPRAARTGTLLMPGASDPELRAALTAARGGAQPPPASEPVATAAAPAAPAAPAREPRAAAHHPAVERPAPPRAQVAPAAQPASVPPPGRSPAAGNRSEPLHLALDARDMVENAAVSMQTSVAPRRGPMIVTIIVGALVLVAAFAWFNRHPQTPVAPQALPVDGVRSSAVPAEPAAAAPAATPAAVPSAAPTPATAPSAVQPEPVKAQAAAPTAAEPKPVVAHTKPVQAKPEPVVEKPEPVAPKTAKKKSKKPSAKTGASSESIEDAREALKALASPPVVKVKRKADDDDGPPAIEQRDAPSPPPLPDPERE
jgi:hypothetical protein